MRLSASNLEEIHALTHAYLDDVRGRKNEGGSLLLSGVNVKRQRSQRRPD